MTSLTHLPNFEDLGLVYGTWVSKVQEMVPAQGATVGLSGGQGWVEITL
jgi:hypothetical protein